MAFLFKKNDGGQPTKTTETDILFGSDNFGFFTIYFPHTDLSLVLSEKEAEYLKNSIQEKFDLNRGYDERI